MPSPLFPESTPSEPLTIEEGEVAAEPRPSRSDAELRKIALGCVEGRIFGSWMLAEHDRHLLSAVFMPLALMDDIQMKALQRDGIVHLFAEISQQAPRGVNGYPIFFGMSTLNADEVGRLSPMIQQAIKMREQFMNEGE